MVIDSLVDVAVVFWSGYQDQGAGHHFLTIFPVEKGGFLQILASLRRASNVRDLTYFRWFLLFSEPITMFQIFGSPTH